VIRWAHRWATAALALAVLAPALAGAQAAEEPTIGIDRPAVRPGEQVMVTLTGFTGRVITVSVCGNQGARASADCNQVASEGIGRNRDGSPTRRAFVVLAPALPCPCVLRAATTASDEVAVVPIELIGHPVGPVVAPAGVDPVTVEVSARRAPSGVLGVLRAALGGPTPYEVTVAVENNSGHRLEHLVLAGAARRGGDDVADLELPVAEAIEPGARWERTVRSTVPAPAVGSVTWEVTASGGGPSTSASTTSGGTPILLLLVVLAFVVDVIAITWRRVQRRRRPGADTTSDLGPVAVAP
jgi:hypothetical protein